MYPSRQTLSLLVLQAALLSASLCLSVVSANAQSVTTPGGNPGSVPVFTDSSTVGSSSISDAGPSVTVAKPLIVNGGSVGSGGASMSVFGYQQYGQGIMLNLMNGTGFPESGATTSIQFSGGARPGGFSMIQSGGTDYASGNGFISLQPTYMGSFREGVYINTFGNVGVDTTSPQGELSIVTGNASSETGEHIVNSDPTGYSVLRLSSVDISDTQPTGLAIQTFNSNFAGDQASAFTPSSSNLTSVDSGGLSLATLAAPLRFFTGGVASANERMRIDPAGNVGIGVIAPGAKLEVNGDLKLSVGQNGLVFPDGTRQTTAAWGSNTTSVGIGTSNPASWSGVSGVNGSNLQLYGNGTNARLVINSTLNDAAELHMVDGAAPPDHRNHRFYADNNGLVLDQPTDNYASNTANMFWANNGNVGVGTNTPASTLEVDGTVTIGNPASGAIAGGLVFAGFPTPQTQPWTGHVGGQDYADSVQVSGDPTSFEVGDVLVIDPRSPRRFLKSSTPYCTLVSGVYSTNPGVVGTQHIHSAPSRDEIPMALVGIVPTKVSTENGPVRVGDLLVTSSVPGHAMKGTDRSQLAGAVVGKALGNLESGTGVIEVLISLR